MHKFYFNTISTSQNNDKNFIKKLQMTYWITHLTKNKNIKEIYNLGTLLLIVVGTLFQFENIH